MANGREDVHEYCRRSHAQEAQARGLAPPSNRQRQGQSTPHNRCSLPGCSAPCYVDPSTGFAHDAPAPAPAAGPAAGHKVSSLTRVKADSCQGLQKRSSP